MLSFRPLQEWFTDGSFLVFNSLGGVKVSTQAVAVRTQGCTTTLKHLRLSPLSSWSFVLMHYGTISAHRNWHTETAV